MSSSDSGDEGAQQEQEVWDDWGGDGEGDIEPVQSLFCDRVFPTAEEALGFDAKEYGFDLRQYRQREQLDDLGTIKVINFMRQEAAGGRAPAEALSARQWDADKYLQPVLPDDGMLQHDFEDVTGPSTSEGPTELQQLREENAILKTMLLEQRVAPPSTQGPQPSEPADYDFTSASRMPDDDLPSTSTAGPSDSSTHHKGKAKAGRDAAARRAAIAKVDGHYFDSYGDFGIHRTMLQDKVRTEAYRRAIQANRAAISGRCVLDVGCGTGILSLFAAEAGAQKVIGVEGSSSMAQMASSICQANEAGQHVTVVPGQLETLPSLPAEQVDVIVSEWMGYALLFESMLDSVLHARDRWLRPGGAMLPDRVTIHLAAASEAALDLGFWDSVYGFSMRPVRESIYSKLHGVVEVLPVQPADIITNTAQIHVMDLTTMQPGDAYCRADFMLTARCQAPTACHSLILWFDAHFTSRFGAAEATVLSTSPLEPQTHWHQAIIMLREPILMGENGGDQKSSLHGTITLARGRSHRGMDVVLEYLGPRDEQLVVHAALE